MNSKAVFPKDNNTQIPGILKLDGSSNYWQGRLLGPTQVIPILVAVCQEAWHLLEKVKPIVRLGFAS